MSYILPRALIVLLAWGASYFILTALSTHVPAAVVYFTGIAWSLAGIAGFGYLYRLRQHVALEQKRAVSAPHRPR
jgi:hypothetical protein